MRRSSHPLRQCQWNGATDWANSIIDFALNTWMAVLTLNAFPIRVSPFQLQNPFSGESVSISQFCLVFFFGLLFLISCWESKQWQFTIQTCVVYDFHRFRWVYPRPHEMYLLVMGMRAWIRTNGFSAIPTHVHTGTGVCSPCNRN